MGSEGIKNVARLKGCCGRTQEVQFLSPELLPELISSLAPELVTVPCDSSACHVRSYVYTCIHTHRYIDISIHTYKVRDTYGLEVTYIYITIFLYIVIFIHFKCY